MEFSEFARAVLLMQAAQNEQLHAIASKLSAHSGNEVDAIQAAIGKKIALECPGVSALLNEVRRG